MKSLIFLSISFALSFSVIANESPSRELSVNPISAAAKYRNMKEAVASHQLSKSEIRRIKGAVSTPIAYYNRPSGTYYVGMSPDTSSLNYGFLLVPAFTELSWTNGSFGTTSSLWEYCTGINHNDDNYTFTQSTDNQIVTPKYEAGYSYPAPYLQASTANADSVFTLTDYLDTDPCIYLSESDRYFYSTNMRPDAEIIAYLGSTVFNNASANQRVDNYYGFSDAGYSNVKLNGVAELYRKPAKPYLLSAIAAHFCDVAKGTAPANVKATIYPVTLDENGNVASMGEPLYEGAGDSETMFVSGRQWQTVLWNDVTATDPVTGRPSDLIISQDILIVIEPTDKRCQLAQYLWASNKAFIFEDKDNTLNSDVSSYLVASATNAQGQTGIYPLPYSGAWYMDDAQTTVGALKSWPIQILAKFDSDFYLDTQDNCFYAPVDNVSSKQFEIRSSLSSSYWQVTKTDSKGGNAEWVDFDVEDVIVDGKFANKVNLTVKVEKLPENLLGREATLKIDLGKGLDIKIYQGKIATDITSYDNILYFDFAEAYKGETITLSLQMKNKMDVVGFQCDFYAPAGTEVAVDGDGFYEIYLSTERTTANRTNLFDFASQKDGAIRILASSTKLLPFNGNEGEIATLKLNIGSDMTDGEYPLILRKIVIADAAGNSYKVDYVKTTLSVSSFTPGDANGDGDVNIADFSSIANHILGREQSVFIAKAADTNNDGDISVPDLSGLIQIILAGDERANAPAMIRLASPILRQAVTESETINSIK